jgi:DNA repair exonuclease SbcCD nuclease subunit
MKIAILGDLHFGARNDSQEFLSYFDKFFEEIYFPELEKRGISQVIQLGDIVDRRKFINYITLNKLKSFVDKHRDNNINLHVLIGNHDVPFRNTNSINSMNELFSDNNFLHAYSDPKEIEIDGCKLLMIPWINSSNYEECMGIMKTTKAQILFGHLEIKGFEMYRGMPSHDGFDVSKFDKFDTVFSGHFHRKSESGNIRYVGTPYEITWSDHGDPRGFHIWDTETRELEFIENTNKMFYKVWYDDTEQTLDKLLIRDFDYVKSSYVKVIVQNKTNPYWFDLFVNKIYEAAPSDVTIVDDHRNMNDIDTTDLANEAEDTLTILSKYVGNLETNVDKKDLDKLMHSLYNESLSSELDQC